LCGRCGWWWCLRAVDCINDHQSVCCKRTNAIPTKLVGIAFLCVRSARTRTFMHMHTPPHPQHMHTQTHTHTLTHTHKHMHRCALRRRKPRRRSSSRLGVWRWCAACRRAGRTAWRPCSYCTHRCGAVGGEGTEQEMSWREAKGNKKGKGGWHLRGVQAKPGVHAIALQCGCAGDTWRIWGSAVYSLGERSVSPFQCTRFCVAPAIPVMLGHCGSTSCQKLSMAGMAGATQQRNMRVP